MTNTDIAWLVHKIGAAFDRSFDALPGVKWANLAPQDRDYRIAWVTDMLEHDPRNPVSNPRNVRHHVVYTLITALAELRESKEETSDGAQADPPCGITTTEP